VSVYYEKSENRGRPFEFKLGAGQVIKGWDQGLLEYSLESIEVSLRVVCVLERRGSWLFLLTWHTEIEAWVRLKLARLSVPSPANVRVLILVFDVELIEIVGVPLVQKQKEEL
jgi:hypothetical protein